MFSMVALKTTNSGSLFSISSPALISCLFHHSLSSRGEVKSHCGFLICISLMISDTKHHFLNLSVISMSSLEKNLIQFLFPFSDESFGLFAVLLLLFSH